MFHFERCLKLELLWIKSCRNVTDASMMKIASNCSNLEELDMSYSYGITHESLTMLGRNCQNLKILKRNLYPRPNPYFLDPLMPIIIAPLDYLARYPKNGNVEADINCNWQTHASAQAPGVSILHFEC
ncbi:putative F-box/LRR-repeat protein 19 [Cardamine amara subsp. amara]|uniref:F-box/LRR-repeat protein 19 n=1 Tax=Cardamine amara subsp. amara TaxID=228776 RepID=A0ABD1BER1_CARAN